MVSFYNPTECFSVERKKVRKKRTSYSNDKFNPLIVRMLAQVSTFLLYRGCRVSQILCISTALNKRNLLYGLFYGL